MGRTPTVKHSTICIDLEELVELEGDASSSAPSSEGGGKGGGKGKKITDFECGCCGAKSEEDMPLFCLGPPVCDGDQTSCDPEAVTCAARGVVATSESAVVRARARARALSRFVMKAL
jgi:hypothetical protein